MMPPSAKEEHSEKFESYTERADPWNLNVEFRFGPRHTNATDWTVTDRHPALAMQLIEPFELTNMVPILNPFTFITQGKIPVQRSSWRDKFAWLLALRTILSQSYNSRKSLWMAGQPSTLGYETAIKSPKLPAIASTNQIISKSIIESCPPSNLDWYYSHQKWKVGHYNW